MKIHYVILTIGTITCSSLTATPKDLRARFNEATSLIHQPSFSRTQLDDAANTMRDIALTADIIHTGLSFILRSVSGHTAISGEMVGGNEALSALYLTLYKAFECALERGYYPPLHVVDGVRTSVNMETALTKTGSPDEPKKGLLFLIPFSTNLLEYLVQHLAVSLSKRIYPDAADYDSRRAMVFSLTSLYDALVAAGAIFLIKAFNGKSDDINNLISGITGLTAVRITRRFVDETIGAWLHAKIQQPQAPPAGGLS